MKNNKCGFLEDANGDKSSKRLLGSVLLFAGIIFAAILFYYSIEKKATDADTAIAIINVFLVTGGTLLGIGTFERINK